MAGGPILTILTILVAATAASAAQAADIRVERVRIPVAETETTIRASITGREIVDYVLPATAGQTLIVRMTTNSGANYFNLVAPGESDVAFFNGSIGENNFTGRLAESGDYKIRVYQMRSAGRRGETAAFALNVVLTSSDYADGLAGGPDFYAVKTAQPKGAVNLRSAPATSAPVLGRLANATVLRNKGCEIAQGRRWCKVERIDYPSTRGWVVGDYLVESGYTEPPNREVDALVPGTEFHATGSIACARYAEQPMRRCDFGVVRRGGGSGYVEIFWPDGGDRTIIFENGTPSGFDPSEADGGAEMTADKDSDLFKVRIGEQRFEIPEAVIFGG